MTHDPLADFDREILHFLESAGVPVDLTGLQTPQQRDFGERSSNAAFLLARSRRQNPRNIAEEIAGQFQRDSHRFVASVETAGNGFLNFRLNYERFVPHVLQSIQEAGPLYGRRPHLQPRHVVVEHTSVNPNKEWHIGHVRNAVLGDVLGRLLRLAGHDVEIQNYIDDTGLQAAQSVMALLDFPEQEQNGEKFDHFAGRSYVKVSSEFASEAPLLARVQEIERESTAGVTDPDHLQERESILARLDNVTRMKRRAMEVMRALEQGEYYPVVKSILDGQLQTAYRLGVYYDLLNWESHLVESGSFAEAMRRLQESSHVYKAEQGRYAGALVIETGPPPAGSDEPKCEVLIRSNGIPTYVAKDIAYHMWKFHLLPDRLSYLPYAVQPDGTALWSTALHGEQRAVRAPDEVINVIAVNQSQAQEAVKEGLRAGGFPQAAQELIHLAYGLVSTAEGRISGRKGTTVAGDTIIDEAVRVALERVQEKRSQDLTDDEMRGIAEAVGVGALRYFMVQYNPLRDIVFDVSNVVSYDGNTGLYIQYALVRTFAILRKAGLEEGIDASAIDFAPASLLQHEQEERLAYHLAQYPGVVTDAARTHAVNLVAEYAFDLATIFSQFYRDCNVLHAQPPDLRLARLLLVRTVRDVLINVCGVLGIPIIERL